VLFQQLIAWHARGNSLGRFLRYVYSPETAAVPVAVEPVDAVRLALLAPHGAVVPITIETALDRWLYAMAA